jgi:uncharacterized protein
MKELKIWDWQQTYTGRKVSLTNPKVEDIVPEDIAHALAHICRFNGQIREHYSVAQHSMEVAKHVAPRLRLEAILHDAAEAYIGDMISPLKNLVPGFRDIEYRFEKIIAEKFNILLDNMRHPVIKLVDRGMMLSEARALMRYPGNIPIEGPLYEIPRPMDACEAEQVFLGELEEELKRRQK